MASSLWTSAFPPYGEKMTTRRVNSEPEAKAQPHDASSRKALRVSHRIRAKHSRRPVIGETVDQIIREVHETIRAERWNEELRVIERVIEQRRELDRRTAGPEDVFVEREVHNPCARAFEAALLGSSERAGRRQSIRGQVEEMITRPTSIWIMNLIRPPRLAELPHTVERAARVRRELRIGAVGE